jgi:hypothetical protein
MIWGMVNAAPSRKPAWIGVLHVRPLPGNDSLGDRAGGAFVVVLAPADSWEEFAESARLFLKAEGWTAITAHGMRPAKIGDDLDDDVWKLAEAVTALQLPAHAAFHPYPKENEDEEDEDEDEDLDAPAYHYF